jgi:RNA polymerase sigma-70 factor, ECF subfamily
MSRSEIPKPQDISDDQLLARFVRGERSALEQLARRYEASLLGLACGMLGGRQDLARDAVQEVWIRVIRFAGTFKGNSSFKTWVYRIVLNQCRTLRKNGRHLQVTAAEAAEATPVINHETPSELSEPNHVLQQAVDRLSDAKRDVLLLCYHRGITHEHAAAILSIPLGTLKSRLNAALTELRASLPAEVMS